MLWILYNGLFLIGFILLLPHFLLRMRRRGGYSTNFMQRLGVYDKSTRERLRGGSWVWVHAVSVGELFVAFRYMEELRKKKPGISFVVSTTTSTGYALASDKIGQQDQLIYFPVDFPPIILRVLNLIRPEAITLVECELWPNLIRNAKKRGIPILLMNGRISEHSYHGYKKLRLFTRPLLKMVDVLCVQSEQDKRRLLDLGAVSERMHILNSAKYDAQPPDALKSQQAEKVLRAAGIETSDLILMGGSTWSGEEAVLLDIYKALRSVFADLVLVLVPRHFERADEVLKEIEARNLTVIRRSTIQNTEAMSSTRPDVLLVDTTGELSSFYSCATVIFVGKSLTDRGGQNIIEPALCGKPIVVGPNMSNFPVVKDEFLEAGAMIQVNDSQELKNQIQYLLQNEDVRRYMGKQALALVKEKAGAVEKTADLFLELMEDHQQPVISDQLATA